jgi:hypothetical protein
MCFLDEKASEAVFLALFELEVRIIIFYMQTTLSNDQLLFLSIFISDSCNYKFFIGFVVLEFKIESKRSIVFFKVGSFA